MNVFFCYRFLLIILISGLTGVIHSPLVFTVGVVGVSLAVSQTPAVYPATYALTVNAGLPRTFGVGSPPFTSTIAGWVCLCPFPNNKEVMVS